LGKRGICRILCVVAFAVLRPGASAGASDQGAYSIDDFEGPATLQNWRFSTGPESPAAGSVSLGPGHRGRGAVLTYRIPCDRDRGCAAYAEAQIKPSSPLPKKHDPAISLWIRFPPEVEVALVVQDNNAQRAQFPIGATIEHPKAGDWQYAVLPLSPGFKGRAAAIGVRVQSRVRQLVQGSVSFDDVELRESSEVFRIDMTARSEPVADSSEWTRRLGVNIHLLRDDHALDLARAAGFGFVRMDMMWTNVERGGRYRFAAYDALLRSLDARGMGVLWILDYGHPDHGGSVPRSPQDIAAFGRFAEAAAAHFKGRNVRYEVWNEPNQTQFWAPSPNPPEYATLLREAIAAIRRGDPSAKVSSGGVSTIDEAFLTRFLDPGLAADLTAIGIHPYRKTAPETVVPELELLRDRVTRAFGDRIEIWDTEWGYSSADAVRDAPSNGHAEAARMRQAVLAVRELLTVWAAGFPLAVWYDLRDDGTEAENPEHNYGLLDSSGNEKPALAAVRTLMGALKGRKYAGMSPEAPAGMYAMRWEGPADTLLVVWTDQPNGRRTVEYSKRNLVSVTGLTGQPVKSKDRPAAYARVEIDEPSGPVYLLWSATAKLAPSFQ
jgi:hypothetical protein